MKNKRKKIVYVTQKNEQKLHLYKTLYKVTYTDMINEALEQYFLTGKPPKSRTGGSK